ncbi:MAG: hypothetical protein IPI43_29135 [Sandaracinaceae bacterium]|nr:hypothetical protein [Sandaracinaceae bacterium]
MPVALVSAGSDAGSMGADTKTSTAGRVEKPSSVASSGRTPAAPVGVTASMPGSAPM